MSTKEHFDAGARDYYQQNYEAPRNRHALTLSLRRTACLSLMPNVRGTVLDLGCGPGAMAVPLVERGLRVVTSDLSAAMAHEAARQVRKLHVEPASVVADALALPFRDSAFAAVVTTGVLEYVPSLTDALREIRRVLQPEGIVIATMTLPRTLERRVTELYTNLRGRPQQFVQYIYARSEFDSAIKGAGFAIDEARCASFAPFPLDALWPPSVVWIDRVFGQVLNRSSFACDRAKTYIVRARAAI